MPIVRPRSCSKHHCAADVDTFPEEKTSNSTLGLPGVILPRDLFPVCLTTNTVAFRHMGLALTEARCKVSVTAVLEIACFYILSCLVSPFSSSLTPSSSVFTQGPGLLVRHRVIVMPSAPPRALRRHLGYDHLYASGLTCLFLVYVTAMLACISVSFLTHDRLSSLSFSWAMYSSCPDSEFISLLRPTCRHCILF